MPGLTLWASAEAGNPVEARERFREAQQLMRHAPDYAARVTAETPTCLMGAVAYPEYPLQEGRCRGGTFLVEGDLYVGAGKNPLVEVGALVDRLFHEPTSGWETAVRASITEWDGDFVVASVDAAGKRCVVFTDPLGRLPLFVHRNHRRLIVSREPKFVARMMREWSFSALGCAEYLWFGFSLGTRTPWREIERAPGAALITFDATGEAPSSRVVELYTPNLDAKETRFRRVEEAAEDLAAKFTEGSRRRASGGAPTVVSLSGGHDSRSVAGSLVRARLPFVGATYRPAGVPSTSDERIASALARAMEAPWELYTLEPPTSEDDDRLLWMKDGLNYVAMSFILNFFDQLVMKRGRRLVYWTGDGGRAFPDMRPVRRPRSLDEAADAVVAAESVMPPEIAENAVGLERGALRAALLARLAEYPAQDPEQKVVHFRVYERWRAWMFEGEDRNRFFFWMTTPFYANEFVRDVMRVPDRFKAHHRIYLAFQRRLTPVITKIPHADIGAAIDSVSFDLRMAASRYLPSEVKALLRGRLPRREPAAPPAPPPAAAGNGSGLFRSDTASLRNTSFRGRHNVQTLEMLERVWERRVSRA